LQFTNGFVKSMYQTPQKPEYLEHVVQTALKTPTNNAVAAMAGMLTRLDWTPVLAKLSATPVLFVGTTPMKPQADSLAAALPSIRTEIFTDAGHALFVDDADRFNALVEQFMAAVPQKS
jgi:microsomal epoxide hydrolase